MTKKNIYFFIGTTAEFIKLAPVIRELKNRKIPFKIITSGQNHVNFGELRSYTGKIDVYYAFKQRPITVPAGIVIRFIIWAFKAVNNYRLFFNHELKGQGKSTLFIVHGDTVTSLLGSLIAWRYGVKLVHIESGLRSFNFLEPFPEELLRSVVSRIAEVHFCPNDWSVKNLKNFWGEKINTKNNTLIETFTYVSKLKSTNDFVRNATKKLRPYCVFVMHRQEHVVLLKKSEAYNLAKFVLSQIPENFNIILLVHDLSVEFFKKLELELTEDLMRRIHLCRRLQYSDFMFLLAKSEFVLTDGGSNQEEMYYMGKPCLLMRNVTERIEGIGENAILGDNNPETIKKFISNYKKYRRQPVTARVKPSRIVVDYLYSYEG